MNLKTAKRGKRALLARSKIKRLRAVRLCVHRTPRHIYAQLITPEGRVVAYASTLDKDVKGECSKSGNVQAAAVVGKYIGIRGVKAGVLKVAFDRSGFLYHGRIAALADAARENGLDF